MLGTLKSSVRHSLLHRSAEYLVLNKRSKISTLCKILMQIYLGLHMTQNSEMLVHTVFLYLDIINIVIGNGYSWKCQQMLLLLMKGENDSFKRSITQSFNPQSMTCLLNERVQNSAPDVSTF